jgi:hypothetical protein
LPCPGVIAGELLGKNKKEKIGRLDKKRARI